MNRISASMACVLAFGAGWMLSTDDSLRLPSATVQAQPTEGTAQERGYNELANARSALSEMSDMLAKVSRLTTNSVVHIQSARTTPRFRLVEETGSGVIIESTKAKGYFVVSNRHVVGDTDPKNISIHLHDGRVLHPISPVLEDRDSDVAVMKVDATGLQAARWGDSDKLEIGNVVLALGSPFGLSQSVTMGIISAKGRRALNLGSEEKMLNQDFLQTDAAINPGNSGGPLIDIRGQVVGINTAIASNSGGNEGIGFSIPSNLVRRVVEQLLEHGKVTRAYLGVTPDDEFNREKAERLRLDRIRGARVSRVSPNSPASRANLQIDDVVLTFDGVEVVDGNHLINLVSLTPVGKRVKLVIFREGKHLNLEVTVGDRSELKQTTQAPTEPGMGTRVHAMGLTLHRLEPDIAVQLGFDAGARGLLVLKVDRDSPVKNELALYDLIEEVGRVPVTSIEELNSALASAMQSDSILLTVRRGAKGTKGTQESSQSLVVVVRQHGN
jgi:serine protease Do